MIQSCFFHNHVVLSTLWLTVAVGYGVVTRAPEVRKALPCFVYKNCNDVQVNIECDHLSLSF